MKTITSCDKCPCLREASDEAESRCTLKSKVKLDTRIISFGYISNNCKLNRIILKDGTIINPIEVN
jgi:hypothetical protein